MISIHCNICNHKIGDGEFFAFYQQSSTSLHLTVKIERRNQIINNLITKKSAKKNSFKQFDLYCAAVSIGLSCINKIGSDLFIGPKAESLLCLSLDSIYFLEKSSILTIK
jgi:hypothetical protein